MPKASVTGNGVEGIGVFVGMGTAVGGAGVSVGSTEIAGDSASTISPVVTRVIPHSPSALTSKIYLLGEFAGGVAAICTDFVGDDVY